MDLILQDYLLERIDKILNEGVENHYTRFTIPKKNKKRRVIHAPSAALKIVQKEIVGVFDSLIYPGYLTYSTGFKPGSSPKLNSTKHYRGGYSKFYSKKLASFEKEQGLPINAISLDIKNAFTSTKDFSIDEAIKTLLEKNKHMETDPYSKKTMEGPADTISKIIQVCTLNGSLPQGAPSSPLLLNLTLTPLDRLIIKKVTYFLNREAKLYIEDRRTPRSSSTRKQHFAIDAADAAHKFAYTRYADDITISIPYPHRSCKFIPIIDRAVTSYGYQLNRRKTKYMTRKNGILVTGINVNNGHNSSTLRRERFKIRAAIHELSKEANSDRAEKLKQKVLGRISNVFSINSIHGARLFLYAHETGAITTNTYIKNRNPLEWKRELL